MKRKKYLAIFMAMSMATATAPVTALADDATTGTESGAETGESGSGETGSTGETGSENGGTEGGSTTAPDTPAENEGVKTIDELNACNYCRRGNRKLLLNLLLISQGML